MNDDEIVQRLAIQDYVQPRVQPRFSSKIAYARCERSSVNFSCSFLANIEMSTVSCVVKIGLRACDIWPYLLSTALYRLFCIIMLDIVQMLQYQYVVIHYYTDNHSHFMNGVSSAMTYSLLFIKLAIL
jgi:hypothetical protein